MNVTTQGLRELFRYDPQTGLFVRLKRRGGASVGSIAGTAHSAGYRQIAINGKFYLAHRLAWLYMTGEWPIADIDHKNGHRADNRFENLRQATRSENKQNENAAHIDSISGFRGVSWSKAGNGWEARIRVGDVKRHLGVHTTKEAAHAAYIQAKRELHPFATDRV